MRRSLLTSLFPVLVALMMTAGFALASLAPGDAIASDDATSPELTTEITTAPGDHGQLPATPAILVHARLRLTSTPPAQTCRRATAATAPHATLLARCRAWLANDHAGGEGEHHTRFEACRRIAASQGVGAADAGLVRRCRQLIAGTDGPQRTASTPVGASARAPG